jgi:nucleotide-binding universal stress UspA family protein
MFKILMATDGSEHSLRTISETIRLAEALKAAVTILYVIEGNPQIDYDFFAAYRTTEEEIEKVGKKILEKAAQAFREKEMTVETMIAKGHPANIIRETAEKGNFDLVILGSRGLGGLKELLLGSVSNAVAHSIKANILIVKK